eukprot:gene26449-35106_t
MLEVDEETDHALVEKLVVLETNRIRMGRIPRSELVSRIALLEKEVDEIVSDQQTIADSVREHDIQGKFLKARSSISSRDNPRIDSSGENDWTVPATVDNDVQMKAKFKRRKSIASLRLSTGTYNSDTSSVKNVQQLLYMPDAFDYSTDLSGGQGSKKRLSEIKSFRDKVTSAKAVDGLAADSNAKFILQENEQPSRRSNSIGIPSEDEATVVRDLPVDDIAIGRSRKSTSVSEFGDGSLHSAVDLNLEPAPQSIFEFCIVEADWSYLSDERVKDMPNTLLTPLLPPRQLWRYPDSGDVLMNELKQAQDQNFFFPSGVKVELVSPTVSALLMRPSNNKRHIVQFSDGVGQITYACCLTTTHAYSLDEIKSIDEKIILNLMKINNMKYAASCIQKCFRKFVEHKKAQSWLKLTRATRSDSFITSTNSEVSHAGNVKKGFFAKIFGQKQAAKVNSVSSNSIDLSSTSYGYIVPEASKPAGHTRKPSAVPNLEPVKISSVTSVNSSATPVSAKRKSTLTNIFASKGKDKDKEPKNEVISDELFKSLKTESSGSDIDLTGDLNQPSAASILYRAKVVDLDYTLKMKIMEESLKLSLESKREVTAVVMDLIDSISKSRRPDEQQQQESTTMPLNSDVSLTPPASMSKSLKNLIIFDLLKHKWLLKELEEILSWILSGMDSCVGESRSRAESFNGTNTPTEISDDMPKHDRPPAEASYTINYGGKGSAVVNEEAALWDKVHRGKHVVTTQRAFCIVSSIPEYTYIFKVLEAIVDAEKNIHTAYSGKDPVDRTVISSLASSSSGSGIMAPSFKNQLCELYENRQEFLHLVRTYMYHRHLKSTDSVQDLPLNFTITKKSSTKVSNTILKKFSSSKDVYPTSSVVQIKQRNQDLSSLSISQHSTGALLDTYHLLQQDGLLSPSRTSSQSFYEKYYDLDSPVFSITIPKYIKFTIDTQSLLNTKEWTCSVLFTHLSSQIVFQIMNLLLMEKSLIIYGKHAGVVTSITLAVINLISPFIWEGLYVPLVPDNARAPVPMILGTTSPPKLTGDLISPSAAILYLNDDLLVLKSNGAQGSKPSRVKNTVSEGGTVAAAPELEFVAWFVRLPEVSASMPVDDEISKRMEYTRGLLCNHYSKQLEYVEQVVTQSSSSIIPSATTPVPGNRLVKNTLDMLLMADVPELISKNVQVLIAAIKRYNFHFFSSLVTDTASWKRFLRQTGTGEMEFFPASFMEPLRNHLEFQEAVVHTQLFVAFMDKLRKDNRLLDNVRRFIGHWIYFRIVLRNKTHLKGQKLRKKLTKGSSG